MKSFIQPKSCFVRGNEKARIKPRCCLSHGSYSQVRALYIPSCVGNSNPVSLFSRPTTEQQRSLVIILRVTFRFCIKFKVYKKTSGLRKGHGPRFAFCRERAQSTWSRRYTARQQTCHDRVSIHGPGTP